MTLRVSALINTELPLITEISGEGRGSGLGRGPRWEVKGLADSRTAVE